MTNKMLLKLTPLGGVGQIGSNMTLVEDGDFHFLIDAGILFPYEDFFDINYLIPDLSGIEKIDTLIITHGHEDHIGAISHVIDRFPEIKIYAPNYAALLIRKKLEYAGRPYPIIIYNESDLISIGQLEIHPIQVNHSIPDTFGLMMIYKKHALGLFFISDFKIDQKTKQEPPFNFKKLKVLSLHLDKRILLADSTNIMSTALDTPSEEEIIPHLEDIFANATNRIFITLFASNVHRLKNIIDVAEKYQFKVIPHGRAIINGIACAQELNIIEKDHRSIINTESISKDARNLVVLLSGCQGDFLGTFRRVAMGEDSNFKPKKEDTFLLSSKAIPGNEKKISILLNKLSEVGSKIITANDRLLHVSGHPGKNDLYQLFNEYQPTDIIPIHGETLFIREHIAFIKQKFPFAMAHYVPNFSSLIIDSHLKLLTKEEEKKEPLIYHGKNILIEKEKISERRKLACNGSVFVTIKLKTNQIEIEKGEYSFLGLPLFIHQNIDHFNTFFQNELSLLSLKDLEKAKESIRISIRRYFDSKIGYKPMTTVHLL